MTAPQPVALLTGASSRIGKEVALGLVEAGFQVVGTSRDASALPGREGLTFVDLDVSSDASVTSAVEQVLGQFGRLDVLVNNAGIGSAGAAEALSVAQDRKVIDVNVLGVIRMIKAVLPHMRAQRRGRIVNVSSVAGLVPQSHMAVYVASKHALEGYSESVDHEVRDYGVRVVLVEPGPTSTPFDAAMVRPDVLMPAYAQQRETFAAVMADSIKDGDDPTTVAKVIVAAVTDAKPRLRNPPASPPVESAPCAASFPPASSISRSARSTDSPADPVGRLAAAARVECVDQSGSSRTDCVTSPGSLSRRPPYGRRTYETHGSGTDSTPASTGAGWPRPRRWYARAGAHHSGRS